MVSKSDSLLEHRHNYLTETTEFNLDQVHLQSSYTPLNELREIRNADAHKGGYRDHKKALVFDITENYLWESLEHAKTYLCMIAVDLA